jgi:uncharacterized protein YjbJ (UPF0337 family)
VPEGSRDIFVKVKEAAEKATDKARELFSEHSDKADAAIDKSGDFVNDKTGGKYSEHVDKVRDAAHNAVDRLSGEGDKGGGAST